ncbi:MAG: type II toxin-antitoxin system RelE/ParE family toxin [Subdoligranulum sp.]|nr:type II toxin-antitoxin system RelE/ParE family toxin [Subdoligranulum sp.]
MSGSSDYKVVYSPEALADIRKIYSYIAFCLHAPDNAERQTNRIRKEIRSLDFMPMRYALVDWEPWKSMQMRKAAVDDYIVYYTVETDTQTVTVIRIVYGGRDIKNIILSE